MLLQGKVAIITGAATGIGQASARLFAQEGARVIIADINDKDGEETARRIRNDGNEASFVHTDITSVSDIQDTVEKAVKIYSRLDIYWHNAGVYKIGHIDRVTEPDFDTEMAVHVKGAVFGTKFAIRQMRKTGGGCILFTSSMVGLRPSQYDPTYPLTYGLAKAALVMLVRCLTEPLAKDNIRVNCICPGPVRTPYFDEEVSKQAQVLGISFDEMLKRMIAERTPLGKAITTDEVANAALFLVSDKTASITGVAFPVDGGFAAV